MHDGEPGQHDHPHRRFVAIGDSLTEGLGDPLPAGGHLGWADRLAARLADSAPQFAYANLAVRGNDARLIRRVQLPAALALEPDLVAAVVGMNDLIRPRLDLHAWRDEVDSIFKECAAAGATVISATLPDMSRIIPLARLLRAKTAAMREVVLERGDAHGVHVIDLWSDPRAVDPALWSLDRLHPNPYGHLLLAADGAAELGLPWVVERPAGAGYIPATRRGAAWAQTVWLATQFAPWVLRRVRGRSSGDGRSGKRTSLSPP